MVKMYPVCDVVAKVFLFLLLALPVVVFPQNPLSPKDSFAIESALIEGKKEVLLDNVDAAIEVLEGALEIDPNNATLHYELARIFKNKEELPKALEHIRVAVHASPDNLWMLRTYASISSRIGNNTDLALAYAGLAKISPQPARYIVYEAAALSRVEQYKDALHLLKNAIKQYPESKVQLLYEQANIYHVMGKHKKEKKALTKILELENKNIEILHNVASSYLRDNLKEEASTIFKKIYEMDPTDSRAVEEYALDDLRRGKYDAFFDKMMPLLHTQDVRAREKVRILMPAIEQLNGLPKQSIPEERLHRISGDLLALHPDKAVVHALAGDISQMTGHPKVAIEHYQMALNLNKNILPVWEQMLRLLMNTSDWPRLLDMTREAESLFPVKATIPYYKAVALYQLRKLSEAQEQAHQSYVMSGRDQQQKILSLILLSLIRTADGQINAALKSIDKALHIEDSAMLKLFRSFVQAHEPSTLKSAVTTFSEIDRKGDCCRQEKPYIRGLIELKSGDFTQAIEILEPLTKAPPIVAFPRWLLYQWLHEAYAKAGDDKNAAYYQSLIREQVQK